MLPIYSLILIMFGIFGILYMSRSALVFNFMANDSNFSYLSTYIKLHDLNMIFVLLIICIISGILVLGYYFYLYLKQNKII